MALDALGIPYDITWQRLAWSSDMVDRSFSGRLPFLWRSSMAVSIYALPLADTADDYPDHRIFYLKVSASITGLSKDDLIREQPPTEGDAWQTEGWEWYGHLPVVYWPCVGALLQVAIYPRPEEGVAEADYPFIVDFEPKKRELYEAVTDAKEVLSGSREGTVISKGNTTTESVDVGISIPYINAGYDGSVTKQKIETTDTSTERRETQGRTTQLSQMYQLFNGYHLGTNRALFAIFPRPHIVSGDGDNGMIENALLVGQRKLEGIQEVMLIAQVPRSVPGICVRAYLDTGHEDPPDGGTNVVTRRWVSGCGEWRGDRLVPVAAPPLPTPWTGPVPPLQIVGEHQAIGGLRPSYREHLKAGRSARVEVANLLNQRAAEVREWMMGNAMSGGYQPRPFEESATFRLLIGRELRGSRTPLARLGTLGYVGPAELRDLAAHGIATVGELFAAEPKGPSVVAVRQRLLDALIKPTTNPAGGGEEGSPAGAGTQTWPVR